MRKQKIDFYTLKFFMETESLYDLLNILGNICSNLNLSFLRTKTKSFEHFRFTFFGLLLKVQSLITSLFFRIEPLEKVNPNFERIKKELTNFKINFDETNNLVKSKKMKEAQEKIILLSKEYEKLFKKILDFAESYF